MYFPIADVTINPILLMSVGFLVGILGGFFGVGVLDWCADEFCDRNRPGAYDWEINCGGPYTSSPGTRGPETGNVYGTEYYCWCGDWSQDR